jgi:hypothetical protein
MDKHQIKARQVLPLPIGSGGNNTTKKQLNDTNTSLSMMMSQSTADTKYDPAVPKHITTPTTIEHFVADKDYRISYVLSVIGVLLIVYGIVHK